MPMIKLIKSLKEAFEVSIPLYSLSRMFQHAIQPARRLSSEFNVRLIWIDSLCIVQDSEGDWRRGSVLEGGVYKIAFCILTGTGRGR